MRQVMLRGLSFKYVGVAKESTGCCIVGVDSWVVRNCQGFGIVDPPTQECVTPDPNPSNHVERLHVPEKWSGKES